MPPDEAGHERERQDSRMNARTLHPQQAAKTCAFPIPCYPCDKESFMSACVLAGQAAYPNSHAVRILVTVP